MNTRRIIFLILAAAASLGAAILLVFAHIDMAEMRTVLPGFNFAGLIAFLVGMVIAGGFVVLLLIWRILGFDPARASSDLKIWIAVLWGLMVSLHLPLAVSISISEWMNDLHEQSFWNALTDFWLNDEGFFLILALLWPVPAIFGLRRYKIYLSQAQPKQMLN